MPKLKLKRYDVNVPVVCPFAAHLDFGVVLQPSFHGCAFKSIFFLRCHPKTVQPLVIEFLERKKKVCARF